MARNAQSDAKKFILVTGASTGIGKAIVQFLYSQNYTIIAGVRKKEDGEILKKKFPKLFYTILDITKDEDIADSYTYIRNITKYQGLHCLINNAGIAIAGSFEDLDIADYRKQLEVNVFGTINVTKTFLPLLKLSKGYICNIGSLTGFFAMPYLSPYSISKHCLEALSDSLRLELRQYGIRVILVEPGTIKTPIRTKAIKDITDKRTHQKLSPDDEIMLKVAQTANKEGIASSIVAKKIGKQLNKKNPAARILVGWDAHILFFIRRFLPAFIRDKIISIYLGIKNHHE